MIEQRSHLKNIEKSSLQEQTHEYPEENIVKNIYTNGQSKTTVDLIFQSNNYSIFKRIKRNKIQYQQSQDEEDEYKSQPNNNHKEDKQAIYSIKFSTQYPQLITKPFQKIGPDPYVVQIHSVFKTPLYLNIKMERCEMTLYHQLIEDTIGNQRPQLCLIYFLSMLYSLTACHSRGIRMHRDIKPQNFVITHDKMYKKLKLIDFGVSSSSDRSKEYTGTELYQAIQVFATNNKWLKYQYQRQYYLPNCDIYSIGVICYHMYCGPLLSKHKLAFPFQLNISYLLSKTSSTKQRNQILKNYYQQIVKKESALLDFPKWSFSGNSGEKMAIMKQFIQKMLQINFQKRPNTLQMYQLINQKREILFQGLENLQVCKDFGKKYQEQAMCQKNHDHYLDDHST